MSENMSENNNLLIKLKNIKHLVLSGGGLLGISYIGLFKYLEESNATNQIKSITGCSAGSIFGTLFILGYKYYEMETIMKSLNFKEFINITADSIIKFSKTKGLNSGNRGLEFFKKMIYDKTGNENTTLLELKQYKNIILQIGVTNLTKMNFEIFNYITKPNLPVYLAIRASVSIPIIFEPVMIDGDVYTDGGVVDNLPIEHALQIDQFICNSEDNTENTENTETTNKTDNKTEKQTENKLDNCIDSVLSVFLMNKYNPITAENFASINIPYYIDVLALALNHGHILNKCKGKYEKNTLIIDIPCDIMTFVKINASTDDIENIIQIAYDIAKTKLLN
jgi:predicted acylesterase/phospholipase RssA